MCVPGYNVKRVSYGGSWSEKLKQLHWKKITLQFIYLCNTYLSSNYYVRYTVGSAWGITKSKTGKETGLLRVCRGVRQNKHNKRFGRRKNKAGKGAWGV